MDYTSTIVTTLAACVVAIVTTTISAWVAVPFALRRFREERRWERRHEAYERVLSGLAHLKAYLNTKYEEEAEEVKVSKEVEAEQTQHAWEAMREIKFAVDLGGFLLTDEARQRLKQFLDEDARASHATTWFDYLEESWSATNSCLDDLTEIAARDLKQT